MNCEFIQVCDEKIKTRIKTMKFVHTLKLQFDIFSPLSETLNAFIMVRAFSRLQTHHCFLRELKEKTIHSFYAENNYNKFFPQCGVF